VTKLSVHHTTLAGGQKCNGCGVTHFMALLLWVAGILAFISQTPELGWAIWAVIWINAIFSFSDCDILRVRKRSDFLDDIMIWIESQLQKLESLPHFNP
jgi:hypothetical protein